MNVLKKLRSWCPQPQDRLSTKIKSYSKPTAIVAATLILAISVTFIFTQYALTQSVAQAPIINTPTENSLNASIAPIGEPSPTPTISLKTDTQNNSPISEDQAISIAMPLIQQYVSEHKRTITSVNATVLRNGQLCITGYFVWAGIPNLVPIYDENGTITTYKWPDNATADSWIFGYDVIINANNGQITDYGPQGVM